MNSTHLHVLVWLIPTLIGGCQPIGDQANAISQAQEAGLKVTVGTVQREIRVGMSGSQVIESLGAPNMVTTDEQRRETWVWDKISTTTLSSRSSGGGTILIFGASAGSGVTSTNQRTLTVIVKFDNVGNVRDFSYRSSSF